MKEKEIEITIKKDGTIEFDQQGFEGKGCDGAINDLLEAVGKAISSQKKAEYYKDQKVKIKGNLSH